MESILEQPVAPLPSEKQLDRTSLHLLPCAIHHDGKANIPSYFFLVNGQYPTSVTTATETVTVTNTDSTEESTSIASTSTTTTTTITTSESNKILPPETSFRGRTLKGTVIPVPSGYIGTIYKSFDNAQKNNTTTEAMDISMEQDQDQDYEEMLKSMQEERKSLVTDAQFKEFTMWGHDEQPTLRTEKVMRAMQWFDIAKVLHQPLC
ncbi:hypothetical protein BGZ49_002411 [Haplosporangium sp. Z 27]|nr:hypothetical protein BGZ49_002411 [Haplosporangium sp. Z 27]